MATVGAHSDLLNKLKESGIALPDNIKRIVIDIPCNEAIEVYYETYASKKMIDITIESMMQNEPIVKEIRQRQSF